MLEISYDTIGATVRAYNMAWKRQEEENMEIKNERFEEQLMFILKNINAQMRDILGKLYAPYGLTSVQVMVLMELKRSKGSRMTMSDLSRQLDMGMSNLSPMCKRLEKAGLIERVRDTEDQRVVHVCHTPKADEVMEKVSEQVALRYQPLTERLTEEERTSVMEGLKKLEALLNEMR